MRSNDRLKLKFGQLKEYHVTTIFLENCVENVLQELVPDHYLIFINSCQWIQETLVMRKDHLEKDLKKDHPKLLRSKTSFLFSSSLEKLSEVNIKN